MNAHFRKTYNEAFSSEGYEKLIQASFDQLGIERSFRISETPVFIDNLLKNKLIQAGEDIIQTIQSKEFPSISANAIPEGLEVFGEDEHTQFLAIDFAICKNAQTGEPEPQLIELQGFPSLMVYQAQLAEYYKKYLNAPHNLTPFLNGYTEDSYFQLLKEVVLNGHQPENVILMDLTPELQKTRVDFILTEKKLGVKAVCPTKLIKEGDKIYYNREGVKTRVNRIYNRLIFDDLAANPQITLPFSFSEPLDVEWAGHPNWFFRISKYTMPYLNSPFVPKTYFLEQLESIPQDLENWVLKPLFSFSGQGVIFNVSLSDIESLPDRKGYILQRKVQYEPIIQAPNGLVKCEIRLLYLWKKGAPKPELCLNLARMSKGVMIGVRYNAELDWVGGTVAFFEP